MAGRRLFGREAQLEVVTRLVQDLRRSRGELLLLAGEPGIGKTRLAEVVVDLARESRARRAEPSFEGGIAAAASVAATRDSSSARSVSRASIVTSPTQ